MVADWDSGFDLRDAKKLSLGDARVVTSRSVAPPKTKTRQRPTLPPRLQGSTIGAGGLNFRVRNGNGCFPSAVATGKISVCE